MRAILLAAALMLSVSPSDAQTYEPREIAQSICIPYRNPALRPFAEIMCKGKLMEALASLVNDTFKLPKRLTIIGVECGKPNAFYAPGKTEIVLCYELSKDIFDRIQREIRADHNTQTEIALGALVFIFLHELGHAVIDIYNLPVLGREEDAADQIGTFMLLAMADHRPEIARNWPLGAHWFFNNSSLFFTRRHYADEHSLNPQRQFNIACWVFGSNPEKYIDLARYAKLPNSRAQRCPGEYRQMSNAAKQMLSPHLHRSGNKPPSRITEQDSRSMAERAAACQNDADLLLSMNYAERNNFLSNCYRNNGVTMSR